MTGTDFYPTLLDQGGLDPHPSHHHHPLLLYLIYGHLRYLIFLHRGHLIIHNSGKLILLHRGQLILHHTGKLIKHQTGLQIIHKTVESIINKRGGGGVEVGGGKPTWLGVFGLSRKFPLTSWLTCRAKLFPPIPGCPPLPFWNIFYNHF